MANNGRQGELLFQEKMEKKGYTVQDVSRDPQYYYKGDFLVTSPTTGETKTFEVKWCQRINSTGNLYLEFCNRNSEGLHGWWEFCEADYLAYGNAKANTFLIIDMAQLRERFSHLPQRIAFCGDDSAGYLVHVSQIRDLIQTI